MLITPPIKLTHCPAKDLDLYTGPLNKSLNVDLLSQKIRIYVETLTTNSSKDPSGNPFEAAAKGGLQEIEAHFRGLPLSSMVEECYP